MPKWYPCTQENSSYSNQVCFAFNRAIAILIWYRFGKQGTFYYPYLSPLGCAQSPSFLCQHNQDSSSVTCCHVWIVTMDYLSSEFLVQTWNSFTKGSHLESQVVVPLRHGWVMKERALTSLMGLSINEFILNVLLGDRWLEENLWKVSLFHVFLPYLAVVVIKWVILSTMFFYHDTFISPQPKVMESVNQPRIET